MAACALNLLAVDSGHTQFLFWPQYRSLWHHHSRPGIHRKRAHEGAEPAKADQSDAPKGPLLIVISVADQAVWLYDDGTLIAHSSVSTGVPGHPTPLGIFSVIAKQRWHRSNIYSAAPMPYMQRITWSGIALHAGVLPGHPASHGCIRLSNSFAIRLWHLTKRGTRVIIARSQVQPVDIASPYLFVRKPKVASSSSGSPGEAVAASNGNVVEMTPDDALAMSNAGKDAADSASVVAPQAVTAPARATSKKVEPISIFVSRKLGKLFVRRGFTPLFDAPVTIEHPEEAMGTHVFTAMEFHNETDAVRWTVVSMPDELARRSDGGQDGARQVHRKDAKRRGTVDAPAPPTPTRANAALERVKIPDDVADRISQLLTPGSSLIVSDYGLSNETGKNTDFIVLTH